MVLLMNLTEPSQNRVLTPPECRLLAVWAPWMFSPPPVVV